MKTLICVLSLCVPAYAGNCNVARVVNRNVVVANAVVVPANFVAVAYAVPVATPSYVQYQYPQYQAASDPWAKEPRATQEGLARAQEAPEAPIPFSLVATHCVRCHTPNSRSWVSHHLDLSGDLSAETRLKMITRILADSPEKRMPKGKQLDAQQIGLLVQEISSVPTLAPPEPPKPEPEK